MWVHQSVSLLKQGRLTHMPPKPAAGQEDVDPDELMKIEIANDPWDQRLKCITEDDLTRGKMPAWILRAYNIDSYYKDQKTSLQSINYGCVVVKSMLWPGSFNFYSNGNFEQIYCGDGLKHDNFGVTFYPVQPPAMMSDRVEKKCQQEPNPTEEFKKAKAELEAK